MGSQGTEITPTDRTRESARRTELGQIPRCPLEQRGVQPLRRVRWNPGGHSELLRYTGQGSGVVRGEHGAGVVERLRSGLERHRRRSQRRGQLPGDGQGPLVAFDASECTAQAPCCTRRISDRLKRMK